MSPHIPFLRVPARRAGRRSTPSAKRASRRARSTRTLNALRTAYDRRCAQAKQSAPEGAAADPDATLSPRSFASGALTLGELAGDLARLGPRFAASVNGLGPWGVRQLRRALHASLYT